MIGSYSWSSMVSKQYTAQSKSGDTYCSGCAANVSDIAITDSIALSSKLCVAVRAFQSWCCVRATVFVCYNGCRIDLHAQVEAV